VAFAGFAALHAGLRSPPLRIGWDGARVLVASAGKVLVPVFPAAFASAEDLSMWPGVLAIVALTGAALRVTGVRRRVVALGAAVFVVGLAPTLAFAGPALDCRLELPACGALLAAVEIARAAWASQAAGESKHAGAIAAAVACLAALAIVTVAFEGSFRDPRAFAMQAVDDAPRSSLAHVCLGSVLQAEGDTARATTEYRTALSLGPAEIAHNNLAVIAMGDGRWTEAERELRSEIDLQPTYARAYANLAIVLRHEGRLEESRTAQARADALAAR
jgi:Flp pilus assembly protein TadD